MTDASLLFLLFFFCGAGYDFAKSSVPLEKATHLYVNASVQFDYDTVEINPFGSETLNVTFAQPVIDKSSKFKHLVYSGYIRLRQVDDDGEMIASKAIHIPYFGVLGNQRELPIFEVKLSASAGASRY